jgi:hypothetical protein
MATQPLRLTATVIWTALIFLFENALKLLQLRRGLLDSP